MTELTIASMTAYARQSRESEWGKIIWELRSVNSRYLEPSFKLPDDNRFLEPKLRSKLQSHTSRGKIECLLKIEESTTESNELRLNSHKITQLLNTISGLESQQHIAKINPLELLQWPGMIAQADLSNSNFQHAVMACFDDALDDLSQTRLREGSALAVFILQRVDDILAIAETVSQRIPDIVANNKQTLLQRIEELGAQLDSERVEQEVAFLAQKIDVSEELDRLVTHCREIKNILNKGGSCGRRLDFLMQELNREANTLGSKSAASDCSQAAVDLKVLIEQMREQIQNIE